MIPEKMINMNWRKKNIRQYDIFDTASTHASSLRKIGIMAYVDAEIVKDVFNVTVLFFEPLLNKEEFKQLKFLFTLFENRCKINKKDVY